MKARVRTTLAVAATMVWAGALSAQSTGPTHTGFDPNASLEGHYHEGDLGKKALILESALKCDCGCGLDAHSCQFQMQCGTSPVWAQRIRDALAAGESPEAIQAGFVADFGKTVLMAPPPEGFNLVGYLLPGVAILTAGMLVGLITRSGRRREDLVPVQALTDEEAARLGAAMKKLDELEGPDW